MIGYLDIKWVFCCDYDRFDWWWDVVSNGNCMMRVFLCFYDILVRIVV